MKIDRINDDFMDAEQARESLELLISQPTPQQLAPCQNCTQHVPNMCSPSCSDASSALSSDPVNFPLEEKVVPFVFELSATRLMQTCWSCEGHFDHEGKLWKIPQICFYASSPVYSHLLIRHINKLKLDKRLSYEWRVGIADFGQGAQFNYSVEPNLNLENDPRLGALQQDLCIIAENLCENLKYQAKKMLIELQ